ncbi:MOSC domain-containing protein [Actinomadura craniellae]|uniref:MOSC domain-containing protein n=1 Tax=Actinomadura craniellae TaxID=2231787 RepID=A0A365H5P9_9ACTN|nr:MOSC N-terminal beta barrel domain-containing protein [Actinomadura craniellae]RAY13563.1 MOSC domain-containing protein [Actinomadura craniellae]
MNGVLRELTAFPLKGGRGVAHDRADLLATGLRHDREFMLVTPEGRFLSQRDLPGMALLHPAYDGAELTVGAPDVEPLAHTATDGGPVLDVYVHRSTCRGVDQGDAAAGWFEAVLGVGCRLVRFTGHRPTRRGGGEVAFADGYPLLVISAESLADLNARLDAPLPMNRFRPNLVVAGLGAYGEDGVRLLRIGAAVIEMVRSCTRCVVTTTDQDTGVRGREPLRTLATYRSFDRGIRFGQNAVVRIPGPLRAGDPVEVLEYQ